MKCIWNLVMHWPKWWQGLPLQAFGAAFVDVSQPFFPAHLHCCHWFCLLPQPPNSNKRLGARSATRLGVGTKWSPARGMLRTNGTKSPKKQFFIQTPFTKQLSWCHLTSHESHFFLLHDGYSRWNIVSWLHPRSAKATNLFSSWSSGNFDHAMLSVAQGYSVCAATLSTCILAANLGVPKRVDVCRLIRFQNRLDHQQKIWKAIDVYIVYIV